MYNMRPLSILDLRRAKDESETPNYIKPEYDIKVIENCTDAQVWTDTLLNCDALTFDIENVGTLLRCIGFAWSEREAVVFPFSKVGTLTEQVFYLKCITQILRSDVPKIAQNAQYDITFLKHNYKIDTRNLIMDTMIAFHDMYPELPKSLATLCSIYTPHPFYKDMRQSEDAQVLYRYNGLDCCTTFEAHVNLLAELKEYGMHEYYYTRSHPLIEPLINIQLRGTKINDTDKKKHTETYATKIFDAQIKLNDIAGEPVNAKSTKQIQGLLYDKFGLPKQYHRKTGNVTADAEALERLAMKHDNEALHLIVDIRSNRTVLETFLRQEFPDGRAHTAYNIAGTNTGRLSSAQSLVLQTGMDLQNIPEKLRTPFIADAGKVLLEVDLSQAENRVVAYLADEERQIRIFDTGGDFHQLMADRLDVTRVIGKKIVHGIDYGMRKRLLSRETGLTEKVAGEKREMYLDEYPGIEHWHHAIQRQLKEDRTLVTPLGRKRVFRGLYGDDMFRKAYAFMGQSTVGDWLNINLVCCYYALKDKTDILLQVYDSMLLQCKPERVRHVSIVIKHYLERPFKIDKRMLSIPCKFKRGDNWGEMEDYKI